MTVAIEMGETSAGAMAALDLEELLATRLLVQGNSGSGKSHLLRRLLEQSAPWVQQTIIDPEGDFVSPISIATVIYRLEKVSLRGLSTRARRVERAGWRTPLVPQVFGGCPRLAAKTPSAPKPSSA